MYMYTVPHNQLLNCAKLLCDTFIDPVQDPISNSILGSITGYGNGIGHRQSGVPQVDIIINHIHLNS